MTVTCGRVSGDESEGGIVRRRGDCKAQAGGEEAEEPQSPEADKSFEWDSIFILMVLYTLQGLPMGLTSAVTMLLKERGASFSDMGTFSLCSWPFSLKLFWAPLVDTVYLPKVGRRKTWMVPAQILIGLVLLALSANVDELLYTDVPAVSTLTVLFFFLFFLCATQDVAVDGWALTMLRPENVSWAATCNSAGQTLGVALGFTGYMTLSHLKIVTLSSFLFWMGICFIVVTVLVAVLKTERPVPPEDEPEGIVTTYRTMLAMIKLRSVQVLILVLATWKMAFPVVDSLASLKIQENGVPKETLAYISSLLMPMAIVLPIIATKWTGQAPMNFCMLMYPVKVAMVGLTAMLVYYTEIGLSQAPTFYYTVLVLLTIATTVVSQFIFVGQMAFFAKVSDPALGGTYMTLLNTLSNLGGMWPSTVSFFLVDRLTCEGPSCFVQTDGFHLFAVLSVLVGSAWYAIARPVVSRMQHWKLEDWRVQ